MIQLDYLKMNTALWKDIKTEHHYNLSGWVDATVELEKNLKKLDKDIEDYVDKPLKDVFNTLDDQLASIDSRKIKTPNLAGDKTAISRSAFEVQYDTTQVAPGMLTLENYTGSSIGKIQGDCIYNQGIPGFTDIMEERYNYVVENVDDKIIYKDFVTMYEPSESFFKKDVSFWKKAAQAAWSAVGLGDLIDAALGYELITGDIIPLRSQTERFWRDCWKPRFCAFRG